MKRSIIHLTVAVFLGLILFAGVVSMVYGARINDPAMPQHDLSAIPLRAIINPTVFSDDNTVNGNCTLREAIIAANTDTAVDACPAGFGADTINLAAGTYNLTLTGSGEDAAATGDLDILEDLTITGVSSATAIIIDAAALGDRVFHIRALSGTVHFENVQIVNGQTNAVFAHGGGIFLDQGALTVSDSRIANNQTLGAGSGGGGIYGGGGAIVLTNTEILSNSATALGGGIQVAFAPLVGSNIRVENNTAVDGGGGINADNVILNNSEVISNRVTGAGGGGGINAGTLVITDTIVASNTTGIGGNGGGLAIALDSSTIVGGQIFGNTADGDGGGIYVAGGSSVTINGPQIYTNTANSQGGGMYISGQVQMLSGQIDDNQAQNGGGLWVNSGAVFTHTGGTIAYNSAPSFPGGGLWVGGTVLINGGQVLSNTSGNSGGGFVIGSGGVVELVSGQIDYNQANGAGGGLWVGNGAVFTQSGGTVAYNSAGSNGGGLWVEGDAWFNGGQVIGNDANNSAGLYISSNGAVTINGGEVVSNTATFYGGGATLANATSYLTMTSGLMAYNSAGTDGGGIYMSDGNLSVSNSRILTNSATTNGGAIYQFNGTTQINNSCIVDNSDTAVAYFAGTSPMDTTGNWWGTADGPSGVATGSGDSVDANVDFSGFLAAPILGCPTKQIFADLAISKTVNPASAAPGETITYTIAFTNNGPSIATNMVITDSFPVSVTIPTVVSSGLAITQTSGYPTYSWQVADMSAGQSGVITLTGQIETTATAGLMDNVVEITATGDITPNNNTATATLTISAGPCYATHDDGGTVFNSVDAQAVQDAVDDAPSGGTVKVAGLCAGVQTRAGVMQTVYISKTLTMRGGYTTTNWTTADIAVNPTTLDAQNLGRVLFSDFGSNLTIANISLVNGVGTEGGGIYFLGGFGNTFTMLAGTVISNNMAIFDGGGGFFGSGDLYINGGEIYANTADSGGGLAVGAASLELNGGEIYDNIAIDRGGGIFIVTDAAFVMNNGTIYDNQAENGGGVYAWGAFNLMANGQISNNVASNAGGGVYVENRGFSLDDGQIISNTADLGGGLYFTGLSDTVTQNGGLIGYNQAITHGGGIYSENTGSVALLGGELAYNDAALGSGGGVYVTNGSTLNQVGGMVHYNEAQLNGGGVHVENGTYYLGGDLMDNLANGNGGAVSLNTASAVLSQTSAVTMLNNTANSLGGAIYLNGAASASLNGAKILTNTAASDGGAFYNAGGSLTVNNSCIMGNSDTAVQYGSGAAIDATGNWWGTLDGPSEAGPGSGDSVSTSVDFSSYHVASILGCPEIPIIVDVAVNKTVTPLSAFPGETITYTIAFSNNGTITATNIMITDTLPSAIQSPVVVQYSGPPITSTMSGLNYMGYLPDMGVGVGGLLTITGQLTNSASAGSSIINTAYITATNDFTPTNNSRSASFTVAGLTPTLVINNVSGAEGAGTLNFTLQLTAASLNTVAVDYTTQNGTALAGADYQSRVGTLTWPPGTLIRTVSVPLLDDILDEPNETFSLNLSNLTNADFATDALNTPLNTAQGTIVDDDFYPDVTISDASGMESSGPLTFTIALSATTNHTVTVTYTTQDGTATAGLDYSSISGTLSIPSGVISRTLAVPVVDDTLFEETETFSLTLTGVTHAYLVDAVGIGTISDDDTDFDLALTKTVTPTMAIAGQRVTYTMVFSNRGAGPAFGVRITDIVPLDTPTQAASTTAASSTITLNGGPLYSWTIDTLPGGTGGKIIISGLIPAGTAPGMLTNTAIISHSDDLLPSNNQAEAVVQVQATEADLLIRKSATPALVMPGELLTFTLRYTNQGPHLAENLQITDMLAPQLTAPSYRTDAPLTVLSGTVYLWERASLAPGASGVITIVATIDPTSGPLSFINQASITATTAEVNAADNSSSVAISIVRPTVGFQQASYSMPESSSAATITVSLSDPALVPVTVAYSTADNTAQAGVDYQAVSGVLTFTPGMTMQQFIVPLLNDTLAEGAETVNLNLQSPQGADGALMAATLTVVDDDVPLQQATLTSDSPTMLGAATTFNLTIIGDNSPVDIFWQWGDGQSLFDATGALVRTHTYTQAGLYTVTAQISNGVNQLLVSTTVRVEQPLAALTVDVLPSNIVSLNTPLTVTWQLLTGTNMSYQWFVVGGPQGSGLQTFVNHSYSTAGVYPVVVTASNAVSMLTATTAITVTPSLVAVALTSDSPTALGELTRFTALLTGTNQAADSYSWQFGDGQTATSTGNTITHVYSATGLYQATVVAQVGSQVVSDSTMVQVGLPPTLTDNITVEQGGLPTTTLMVNLPATMTIAVTGDGVISMTWDVGDGPVISGDFLTTITHSYDLTGSYTIVVTMSNPFGVLTETLTIIVVEPVVPLTDLLLVEKSATSILVLGQPLVYEMTVRNVSSITAANVTLTDLWPTDGNGAVPFHGLSGAATRLGSMAVGGQQAQPCTLTGRVFNCAIGDMAGGSTARIKLLVTPRLTGTLVSTVTVSSDTPDPNLSNNSVQRASSVVGPAATDPVLRPVSAPTMLYLPLFLKE